MPNKPPVIPTKEQIQEYYVNQKLTIEQVAKVIHCRRKSVSKAIKDYNLVRVHRGQKVKIGNQYGYLTVIDTEGKMNCVAVCQCVCGQIRKYKQANLIGGNKDKGGKFRSCGCQHIHNQQQAHWHGTGEICVAYWSSLKRHASKRKWSFHITPQEAWDLFSKQNRKCALTGLPLTFSTSINKSSQYQTASLDRINSKGDYTKDNVQWVHKEINRIKNNYSQDDFVKWCCLVANHFLMHNSIL